MRRRGMAVGAEPLGDVTDKMSALNVDSTDAAKLQVCAPHDGSRAPDGSGQCP